MNRIMFHRIFIILCSVLPWTGNLVAQLPLSTMQSLDGYVNRSGKYLMQLGDDETVEGSPYLEDEFKKGDLKLGGDWYRDVDMRYDAYNGVFEVQLEEGVFVIRPDANGADSVLYNDEVFVMKDMHPGKAIQLQYMSLLYRDADVALVKKYRVRINNAKPSDGYSDEQPAEFRNNPPVYYVFSDNKPAEIKGRGSLADIFGVENSQVRKFLRKHKYKLNDEDDLVKVVEHFSGMDR